MSRLKIVICSVFAAVTMAACGDVSTEALDPNEAELRPGTPEETASPDETLAPTRPGSDARLYAAPPLSAVEARVARVTDGDTIVLTGIDVGAVDRATGGRKSRLIGVDTPEVFGGAECYGAEASAFTKRELDGRQVLVDFDIGHTDRYGRALVYVWTSEDEPAVFFNASLAAEGYALQLTVPPNVRYAELFGRLVREAREANRGRWAGCREPGGL